MEWVLTAHSSPWVEFVYTGFLTSRKSALHPARLKGSCPDPTPTKPEGQTTSVTRSSRCGQDSLQESFSSFFNLSLRLMKAPNLWKTSCIIPVPKTRRPSALWPQTYGANVILYVDIWESGSTAPEDTVYCLPGPAAVCVLPTQFLGVQISNKLDWSHNTDDLFRKAPSRLFIKMFCSCFI